MAAKRTHATPENRPFLTPELAKCLGRIHNSAETILAGCSATKQLFDTACVLEVDVDSVLPLLEAGSTISDNQSRLLCELIGAISSLYVMPQGGVA